VGALTIQRGVALEGLQALLAWLSLREGTESVPPSIPAVIIGRVAYDRLTLADDVAVQAEIDAIWQALAVAALDDTVDAAFGTAYPPTDAPHTEPPAPPTGPEATAPPTPRNRLPTPFAPAPASAPTPSGLV
jgi:hypothetical protein